MKNFSKSIFLITAILFCAIFCACRTSQIQGEHQAQGSASTAKIANWNLQTFFDATPCGTEYSGFTAKDKSWTEQKYTERLEKLCRVISSIDADILCLEEIENSAIIYDIVNNYAFQARSDKAYNYACFAGEKNQAFGLAILSRYPILDYSTHQIDIRSEPTSQPQTRPVLNAKILVGQKILSLYACHWKSKSGGQEKTEIWRDYQEAQLANLISHDTDFVFACGDFNRDLTEFTIIQTDNTDFVELSAHKKLFYESSSVKLNSAWLSEIGKNFYATEGSYFYKDTWSKIDHFFYSDNILLTDFCTIKTQDNATAEGKPYRYSVWNGTGASDHLPISCRIEF